MDTLTLALLFRVNVIAAAADAGLGEMFTANSELTGAGFGLSVIANTLKFSDSRMGELVTGMLLEGTMVVVPVELQSHVLFSISVETFIATGNE